MSAGYAIVISVGVCILAATLEGVCAGKDVKGYYAQLRFPAYSAPLWIWYIIGGLYYGVFFYVMYRLLRHYNDNSLNRAALTLVLIMMVVNALWNYVFFRARKLFVCFVAGSLFPVLDVTLLVFLIQLDKVAAWALVPYLLYRLYAVWWGYGLWKLNGRVV